MNGRNGQSVERDARSRRLATTLLALALIFTNGCIEGIGGDETAEGHHSSSSESHHGGDEMGQIINGIADLFASPSQPYGTPVAQAGVYSPPSYTSSSRPVYESPTYVQDPGGDLGRNIETNNATTFENPETIEQASLGGEAETFVQPETNFIEPEISAPAGDGPDYSAPMNEPTGEIQEFDVSSATIGSVAGTNTGGMPDYSNMS